MTLKQRWPTFLRYNRDGWKSSQMSWNKNGYKQRVRYSEIVVSESLLRDSCRIGRGTLIELAPKGPVIRGVIPNHMDQKRSATSQFVLRKGEVQNAVPGKSFDITAPGTDIREHYEMTGDRFVGPSETRFICPSAENKD